jgi:hypothetical protein
MRNILASAVLSILAAWFLLGEQARADSAAAPSPPRPSTVVACGFPVNAAIYAVWRDLGAETGRLGCATQPERPGPASPQGSAASLAVFGSGEVVLHVGGPRVGQAFAIVGCFYRLYVQFGGTSGWLGLPVSDAQNTPDGSHQIFEGGDMRYTRAYDDCQATPSAGSEGARPIAAAADGIPLDLYENPATGDRLSLASQRSVEVALGEGYVRLRPQARVLPAMEAEAAPLKLYQNEARGLRQTLATPQSERDALAEGFVFEAGQGYVWTLPRPGAVVLKLYRNAVTGAARLTAGPTDEADALAAGLTFQRIEGYAAPPS